MIWDEVMTEEQCCERARYVIMNGEEIVERVEKI